MKELRVFIGSSKELEKERRYLAYLTISLHEAFRRRNLTVNLSKWEYIDPTFTSNATEERYLERMRDSDLTLIIYWKFLGKYTQLESRVAGETTGLHEFRLARRFVLFKERFGTGDSRSEDLRLYKKQLRREVPADQYGEFRNIRH